MDFLDGENLVITIGYELIHLMPLTFQFVIRKGIVMIFSDYGRDMWFAALPSQGMMRMRGRYAISYP
jgi:hypothetical protein